MASSNSSRDTDHRLLHLSADDNVCVARVALVPGERVSFQGNVITVLNLVPVWHKVAVRPVSEGERVVKHGTPIGSATRPIAAGDHVHAHNLRSDYVPAHTARSAAARPEEAQ